MLQVIFNYDEANQVWDPVVKGAVSATEATQAFNAVVLSCQALEPRALRHTLAEASGFNFKITPAEIV